MTLYSRKRGVVSRFDSVNRVYFDIQIEYLFSYSQLCSSEFSRLRYLQFRAGAFVSSIPLAFLPDPVVLQFVLGSLLLCRCAFTRTALNYGHPLNVIGSECTSLLLYEPYANVSSQICPFLAVRPQFHSKNRVNLSTPRYCQSDTFGRLTFAFILCFLRNSRLVSPRPPRTRHAHRANRSAVK